MTSDGMEGGDITTSPTEYEPYSPPAEVVAFVGATADDQVYDKIKTYPAAKAWISATVRLMANTIIQKRRESVIAATLQQLQDRLTGCVQATLLGRQGRIVLLRIDEWPDDAFIW